MSASNGGQGATQDVLADLGTEGPLELLLPAGLVDRIAERAAAILRAEGGTDVEPWLAVGDAAAHLACPRSRIYALVSARRIPHHRDGSRLLFRRSELDAWVERGGARRP